MSALPSLVMPCAVPGVWHADVLETTASPVVPTGHALLDAQLPAGGWPHGALSEVLQAAPGRHEWALLLPALVAAMARQRGAVVAVAPPHEPFGMVLQAQGLPSGRICVVRAESSAALWAAEQALRCQDVLAVLAWLPQAQPPALRRLQWAAAQRQQLLWVFRPVSMASQASPAPLRLQLSGRVGEPTGMRVRILKRRGPPLEQALDLPGCHPRLVQALAAQARRRQAAQRAAAEVLAQGRRSHALARIAPVFAA